MKTNSRELSIKILILVSFIAAVASVFYYSWLPYSNLKTESYLPHWLLQWSNEYVNLRTAIPFVFIGFLIEVWINSFSATPRKAAPFRFEIIGIAAVLVSLAEGGQFFIEDRHPDYMDIVFGIMGSICGFFLYSLSQVVIHLLVPKK